MSNQKIILVAVSLCFVCSLIVSGAAVGLREMQERNAKLSMRKNVLLAAGLVEADVTSKDITTVYDARIRPQLVDFDTGMPIAKADAPEWVGDPADYQQRKAAKEAEHGVDIPSEYDPTSNVKRRAKIGVVYMVKAADSDTIENVILPVEGMGLWGTMYAYLALQPDLSTVKGMVYYEHKETPGLGAEVDNPAWRAQWDGKRLFDDGGGYRLDVTKGTASDAPGDDTYQVDGISGATITCNGVEEMLAYWTGPHAYGPYLKQLERTLAKGSN